MKSVTQSKTVKYANLQKFLATCVITINFIGVPVIIGWVPNQYKTYAFVILAFIDSVDSVYGLSKSQNVIIEERLLRGDLVPEDESSDSRKERLALKPEQVTGSVMTEAQLQANFPYIDEYQISKQTIADARGVGNSSVLNHEQVIQPRQSRQQMRGVKAQDDQAVESLKRMIRQGHSENTYGNREG